MVEKFIYPLYLKYTKIQEREDQIKNGRYDINEKIEKCVNKIIEVVGNEKGNPENLENIMETDEIDYDMIHEEIIDSIVPSENESGLSDLEDEFEIIQRKKNNIFHIAKNKNIINKETECLFKDTQHDNIFNPFNNITCSNKKGGVSEENDYCINSNIDTFSESDHNANTDAPLSVYERNNNIYKDPYSNYNKYNRDYIPKMVKNTERFKNRVPFLKTFNPKFLKKENIDKKIFRRFRNFVKEKFDVSQSLFFEYDQDFWNEFCHKNLLPPMKYTNVAKNNTIEFKSFNTKYFLWLFNQKGSYILFNLFLQNQGESVIKSFISEYDLENSNEENIISKLRTYIRTIPQIYSSKPILNSEANMTYDDLGDTYLGMKEINNDAANVFSINFNFSTINSNSEGFPQKTFKEDRCDIDWNLEDSHCDLYNYTNRLSNPAINILSVD